MWPPLRLEHVPSWLSRPVTDWLLEAGLELTSPTGLASGSSAPSLDFAAASTLKHHPPTMPTSPPFSFKYLTSIL